MCEEGEGRKREIWRKENEVWELMIVEVIVEQCEEKTGEKRKNRVRITGDKKRVMYSTKTGQKNSTSAKQCHHLLL